MMKKSFQDFFLGMTFWFYSFTLNNLRLFNATISVAPISDIIAIQSVNHPGTTRRRAKNLIPSEKVIFPLMILKAFRLKRIV